jgi:hypothetical protein
MDNVEAYEIVQKTLEKFQKKPFTELVESIGIKDCIDVESGTSKKYQIDVNVNWNDKNKDSIRIEASISDLNWYKFSQITEQIVIKPEEK